MRLLLAALVLLAPLAPTSAHAEKWFPVQGDATIGGSFGHYGLFNANLYLGYANGFRRDNRGMLFSFGPTYTYRGFNRESVGCRPLVPDANGKTTSDGCGSGYSLGFHVRIGYAWANDDDHRVPDHFLYLGVTPFRGQEPRLQLSDGDAHDRTASGFRVMVGYNFMALSRAITSMDMKGKDDAGLILLYPLALFNKLEFHYERVLVSEGKNDSRFGIATGFGF